MKLRELQNQIGRYNIFNPGEETFEFTLAILDDNNKVVEENGVKARLQFSGSPEYAAEFMSPLDNLSNIFKICYKYARQAFGSIDYKAQCLLFSKLFKENFEELNATLVEKRNANILKQIEELQTLLKSTEALEPITDSINSLIKEDINFLQKKITLYEMQLADLKEGTPLFLKKKEALIKCMNNQEYLQKHIINDKY